jgi:hypothetical protein
MTTAQFEWFSGAVVAITAAAALASKSGYRSRPLTSSPARL